MEWYNFQKQVFLSTLKQKYRFLGQKHVAFSLYTDWTDKKANPDNIIMAAVVYALSIKWAKKNCIVFEICMCL